MPHYHAVFLARFWLSYHLPYFPTVCLSPFLIKHGLDVISQSCLLVPHIPSIDFFQGAPESCSPSTTLDLPLDETKHQGQASLSNAAV